jgi:EpsI family protein
MMPSEMIAEETASAGGGVPAGPGAKRAGWGVPAWRFLVVFVLLVLTVPVMRMADGSEDLGKYPKKVDLTSLPRNVGPEQDGKDIDLDKVSISELDPDDYLWRVYTRPYSYRGTLYPIPLDFLVVYGHKKQTFHSPGFCLPGGGWQIVSKSDAPVDADGLPMPMNLFQIQREIKGQQAKQVVLYCFVQGDRATSSLVAHNVNLLRARIRHQRPTGALVRVIVPVVTTEDEAIGRGKEFISRIYHELRKRLNGGSVNVAQSDRR